MTDHPSKPGVFLHWKNMPEELRARLISDEDEHGSASPDRQFEILVKYLKENDMTEKRYAAMTVNERLFAADLLAQFDDAVNRQDRAAIIKVLCLVELSDEQAEEIADSILADPAYYGYPRNHAD
ncbi:MAG: hypothetical protein U1E67_07115 [Hyphomicrobiales bacterium]